MPPQPLPAPELDPPLRAGEQPLDVVEVEEPDQPRRRHRIDRVQRAAAGQRTTEMMITTAANAVAVSDATDE